MFKGVKSVMYIYMTTRDILVVFDIDETLIQFINKNAYKYWQAITPEQRRTIENKELEFIDLGPKKQQVIFIRPGLREFLEMARDTGRVKVALWTYSEREYAEDVANFLCDKFNLPKDTFIFKYGTEDIKDHDNPKSLKQIWDIPKYGKKFNKFNTFLVDDRFGNLCHDINENNSILVQAFAPFGETKQREPLTDALLTKAIEDNIFSELTVIVEKLLSDIDGCSDEEVEDAFNEEAVFAPRCMKRKGLANYVKKYKNDIKLCTIGDVEHAASTFKGGKRTTRKMGKRRYRKTRKNKRKSKRRGKSLL